MDQWTNGLLNNLIIIQDKMDIIIMHPWCSFAILQYRIVNTGGCAGNLLDHLLLPE